MKTIDSWKAYGSQEKTFSSTRRLYQRIWTIGNGLLICLSLVASIDQGFGQETKSENPSQVEAKLLQCGQQIGNGKFQEARESANAALSLASRLENSEDRLILSLYADRLLVQIAMQLNEPAIARTNIEAALERCGYRRNLESEQTIDAAPPVKNQDLPNAVEQETKILSFEASVQRCDCLSYFSECLLNIQAAKEADEVLSFAIRISNPVAPSTFSVEAKRLRWRSKEGPKAVDGWCDLLQRVEQALPADDVRYHELQILCLTQVISQLVSKPTNSPLASADEFNALRLKLENLGIEPAVAVLTLLGLNQIQMKNLDYAAVEKTLRTIAPVLEHPRISNFWKAWYANEYGLLQQALGKYGEAMVYHEKAFNNAAQGGYDEQAVVMSDNLGLLHLRMGDYEAAKQRLSMSKSVYEKFPTLPGRTMWLVNYAKVLEGLNDFPSAEAMLQTAHNSLVELGDSASLQSMLVENNLAVLKYLQGSWKDARELFEKNKSATVQTLGAEHLRVAECDINLGWLEIAEGHDENAAERFSMAADLIQRTVGREHPRYAESLTYLARVQSRLGLASNGRASMDTALEYFWKRLEPMLSQNWSPRDRLAMVQELRTHPESPAWPGTIDSFLEIADSLGYTTEQQYREMLRWKGIIERFDLQDASNGHMSSEAQELRLRLEGMTSELRKVFFEPVSFLKREARRRRIGELESQIEATQRQLDGLSKHRNTPPPTPTEVANELNTQTALLDVLQIRLPNVAEAGQHASIAAHYIGFLVRLGSDPVRIDFGPQAILDDRIEQWRGELFESSGQVERLGHSVAELVWEPIKDQLQSIQDLRISSDGVFFTLPWHALPIDEGKTRLLDRLNVIHGWSPKSVEVPRLEVLQPTLLAIGNVDYGPLSEQWQPLPATATESAEVTNLFRNRFVNGLVELLELQNANEELITTFLPKSKYVHLATHGFFDPPPGANSFGVQTWTAQFQSGLIVAPPSSAQSFDQYLTAEEISSLNLRSTELVVLSACDSGRGSIQAGQGMVGLQHAFLSAGAKGVISSLWKVDDRATAELMKYFYSHLWRDNMQPAEALRQAQQELRSESKYAAPGYWAAFTYSQR
ncbi:MAG: CHAT domain-containing tetratricopeptide repeat protein [Pirellulaceae bacterium]|nr:CHAT domain-containing tetratricopeptide repeat protein [Pirellulaceae bacterium]